MPLSKDPDKWELAFIERGIRAGKAEGMRELHMIDQYVTAKYGVPVDRPNHLELYRRGRPGIWMHMPRSKHLAALEENNRRPPAQWRYEHAFRPIIDDLRRKLRRYRKPGPDACRLTTMADIIELCMCGAYDEARRLASSIDESAYLEGKLLPKCFPHAIWPDLI
jgi:hypothetical protein